MFHILTRKTEEDLENEKLIEETHELYKQIQLAYERYDYIIDDDLIEASIYEIEALKSRLRYMLNLAKERGLSAKLNNSIKTIYEYSEETRAS